MNPIYSTRKYQDYKYASRTSSCPLKLLCKCQFSIMQLLLLKLVWHLIGRICQKQFQCVYISCQNSFHFKSSLNFRPCTSTVEERLLGEKCKEKCHANIKNVSTDDVIILQPSDCKGRLLYSDKKLNLQN